MHQRDATVAAEQFDTQRIAAQRVAAVGGVLMAIERAEVVRRTLMLEDELRVERGSGHVPGARIDQPSILRTRPIAATRLSTSSRVL